MSRARSPAGSPEAPAAAGPEITLVAHAGGDHVLGLLARVEDVLRDVVSGHGAALAGHAGSTIAAGGKRLRPLLVILAAGREPDPPDGLVRAAAAVELVHSATLVHDDVLDLAPLRRGRPTVFATAGRRAATQTGDLLFSRAFALLARNGLPAQVRALSDAGSALARGELLQRADAWDAGVSLERYLLRCELKTARLFEAACELGAIAAGDTSGVLREFGRRIGLAFQIFDDVLDVAGPADRTGKHRGTDLLDGTVTLPFILARAADEGLGALDPRSIREPAQAEAVCDRIAATGALEAARRAALEHVGAAKDVVPVGMDARQRRALLLVADSVVARYS
ncbi:polyprenyl synthetase family protein [Baekduia soli]|uniref:Polyprenyl synthetase family protein n=1 Tax=Baekduia soli TaxID=496014 RepID=A0A5B8U1F7_9ACTN|nr:polyprenyl synthetase family protein [Baekduia soli]QEC46772.1 polyprenyl synthetase family protein [Baekduia soli]